jgi:hypothetical protein
MVFTVQEMQNFFTMNVEPQILHSQNVDFLLLQPHGAVEKQRCAQESRSLPFHRCFTLLPSESKSTIAKALTKQSVRLCDGYVIVTQEQKLD